MAKYTPHPMSEEDKRLARSEDSFSRFLLAFAVAAEYGMETPCGFTRRW